MIQWHIASTGSSLPGPRELQEPGNERKQDGMADSSSLRFKTNQKEKKKKGASHLASPVALTTLPRGAYLQLTSFPVFSATSLASFFIFYFFVFSSRPKLSLLATNVVVIPLYAPIEFLSRRGARDVTSFKAIPTTQARGLCSGANYFALRRSRHRAFQAQVTFTCPSTSLPTLSSSICESETRHGSKRPTHLIPVDDPSPIRLSPAAFTPSAFKHTSCSIKAYQEQWWC